MRGYEEKTYTCWELIVNLIKTFWDIHWKTVYEKKGKV